MDQRKFPRFPVQFRSSFNSTNVVDGEGEVLDLSFRGCRVFSVVDVQPGTTLQLRIHTSDQEPPIVVDQAVVRWDRNKYFGLEFASLRPDEWARLQHTVKQIEMEPYQRLSDDNTASA